MLTFTRTQRAYMPIPLHAVSLPTRIIIISADFASWLLTLV